MDHGVDSQRYKLSVAMMNQRTSSQVDLLCLQWETCDEAVSRVEVACEPLVEPVSRSYDSRSLSAATTVTINESVQHNKDATRQQQEKHTERELNMT